MKKVLPIAPEIIDDHGDCISICLDKLFAYYGKHGLPYLYQQGYKIYFDYSGKIENFDGIEITQSFRLEEPPIIDLMKENFNISTFKRSFFRDDMVKYFIDNDVPVVLAAPGKVIDWAAYPVGRHAFIIGSSLFQVGKAKSRLAASR